MQALRPSAAFLLLISVFWTGPTRGQAPPPEPPRTIYNYSAKFVCGYNDRAIPGPDAPVLVAGLYLTEVNIQRVASGFDGDIELVAVEATNLRRGPGEFPPVRRVNLTAFEAKAVDCHAWVELLRRATSDERVSTDYYVGFLRISSFEPLHVVGVYTAKECHERVNFRFRSRGERRPDSVEFNTVCSGDIALDVVPYQPVLTEVP